MLEYNLKDENPPCIPSGLSQGSEHLYIELIANK
jgi:hypothetical protein